MMEINRRFIGIGYFIEHDLSRDYRVEQSVIVFRKKMLEIALGKVKDSLFIT